MTEPTDTPINKSVAGHRFVERAQKIIAGAAPVALYGSLVIVFAWYGGMKFTAYEAEGIRPIIESSPLVGFLLLFGTQGASNAIGVVELAVAALLSARLISARFAAIGAVGAVVTFLLTLSFMFTTPGVLAAQVGPLALSAGLGLFLLKDLVLLAASLAVLGEALTAITTPTSVR